MPGYGAVRGKVAGRSSPRVVSTKLQQIAKLTREAPDMVLDTLAHHIDLEALQKDLDEYIDLYNYERTHQGKSCKGRTPIETFIEGKEIYNKNDLEKGLAA